MCIRDRYSLLSMCRIFGVSRSGYYDYVKRLGPVSYTHLDVYKRQDMKSTVLTATSSYALLLAEEIEKRQLTDKICLRKGLIGSERWGEKMRRRIAGILGAELYDIYGLTEVYGPGIGISCDAERGMHMWDDYIYFEVVDPKTGAPLPDGEIGELVITTLRQEGAPLIRYRTHDLTRVLSGDCPCGSPYPRIDTLIGRTDDMVKVKGVNIFPSQIDELLREDVYKRQAQRGGSVVSHLRMGGQTASSLVPRGQADLILGFEPAEALRCLPYLKEGGILIAGAKGVYPVTASLGLSLIHISCSNMGAL